MSIEACGGEAALRIEHGTGSGRHCLISAGVHGDEFEPVAALWQLSAELRTRELQGRVTLILAANPGACARGTRVGEDGLDLARTCPGNPDGSPTERAASFLSGEIRKADYYLDLHTGGKAYRISPFSGYFMHPEEAVLQMQRKIAVRLGMPLVWGTSPDLEGRSLSVARDAGVPALYLEAGGGGTFSQPMVQRLILACRKFLISTGFLEGEAPPAPVQVLEDERPGSGYLQDQHPAPMAGIFMPSLEAGATVKAGDELGRVLPRNLKEGIAPIKARESGILIALRANPFIKEGDSIGVVIES